MSEVQHTYFSLLASIDDQKRRHDYTNMLIECERTWPILNDFVNAQVEEYGNFDLSTVPAIELGALYCAALGRRAELEHLASIVGAVRGLEYWKKDIDIARELLDIRNRLIELLKEKDGRTKTELTSLLGVEGWRLQKIMKPLENIGAVRIKKAGTKQSVFLIQVPVNAPSE